MSGCIALAKTKRTTQVKANHMEPRHLLAMKNPDQSSLFAIAEKLLDQQTPAALVMVVEALGSTPRNAGTQMIVTRDALFGTIGGGRLEWMVCEEARGLIEQQINNKTIESPLGPEIGQCCGGKVVLEISRLQQKHLVTLQISEDSQQEWTVQIHGAGHTGHALCRALALLPFKTEMVDCRAEALVDLPDAITKSHTPLPEASVKAATADTAFVIFTHDHQLDFLIAAEALKRGDATYVGMIGSKTKRAVFKNWLQENGYDPRLAEKLVSPIGNPSFKDKRPEIIAALVAAELIQLFSDRN